MKCFVYEYVIILFFLKWHLAGDGDQRFNIISYEHISADNFYCWNPEVGGSRCDSLWAGYYVCVGV